MSGYDPARPDYIDDAWDEPGPPAGDQPPWPAEEADMYRARPRSVEEIRPWLDRCRAQLAAAREAQRRW